MESREIEVRLLSPGHIILLAGIRYHIRSITPEPARPDYVFITVAGSAKPWHKRLDDLLPVAYV